MFDASSESQSNSNIKPKLERKYVHIYDNNNNNNDDVDDEEDDDDDSNLFIYFLS